ncbi:MAG: hypothetical protein AAF411_08520 [Myxococcota bacterium]
MAFRSSCCLVMIGVLAAGCSDSTDASDLSVDAQVDGAEDSAAEAAVDAGVDEAVDEGAPELGPEPCETPGATETVACGRCGSATRFCTSAGVWEVGPCEGETGTCTPGDEAAELCGNCGERISRCNESCEWETTGECSGEGECAPGASGVSTEGCEDGANREVVCSDSCEFEPVGECASDPCDTPGALETVACGNCGTTDRFCTVDMVWEYGPCEREGVCAPGTSEDVACGNCGQQRSRCNELCEWVPTGDCEDEGICAPGQRRATGAGCDAGEERILQCSDACLFDEEVVACMPPSNVDVIVLREVTGSMADDAMDEADFFADCIRPLLSLDQVNVGVAFFGEFSDVSPSGILFQYGLEPTDDINEVRTAFLSDAPPETGGGDGPDALIEGLWSLAGQPLHPEAGTISCTLGRDGDGCWRTGSQRIVLVWTDSEMHNGPDPDGRDTLFSPYGGISPPPAEWPDVRSELQDDGTLVLIVEGATSETAQDQIGQIIDQLGQPATDAYDGTPAAVCTQVVRRITRLL